MKIDGNELRPGFVIVHEDRLFYVVKTEHVKPGKGGAYMQAELRDVQAGTKVHKRFRSSETVERARVEEATYQFLFEDKAAGTATVMHPETFEQVTFSLDLLGEGRAFLSDGIALTLQVYEGQVINAKLPKTVTVRIAEVDPVVKGQTASASYKPAVLENGVRVMVPPHIAIDTLIVVNTEDSTYVERAK